ncbi:hypothetical protein [Sulfurimonas sp.]|uniref:hypothetical protein n=1 Tax=Sulfurimonas sp. TaxID=2022749 RepID=UPI0025FC44D7|nr:hypothetical protein [Sulfurimonas sp.]MBW6487471.1 hypothetical protein [Sulfurimonas sp.]
MKNLIIEREGRLPLFISKHMEKRLKERKGLNRKAIKRYVVQAIELGETIQKNIERGAIKAVNLFKGDSIIFYIERETIYIATILTRKSIAEEVTYVKGARRKREFKYMRGSF